MLLRLLSTLFRSSGSTPAAKAAEESVGTCLERGLAIEKEGRLTEALACYRACAERFPHELQPRLAVANALSALWRIDECIATFSDAMTLVPHADAPRSEYLMYCYHTQAWSDDTTERIARAAHAWRQVAGDDDDTLARRIRDDGIDVLVDLSGHTRANRLRVFARRAAPMQMTWLGYPDTTGVAAVDYRITDAIADPAPVADALHTEQLLRLPTPFLTYQPPADSPAVAPRDAGNGTTTTCEALWMGVPVVTLTGEMHMSRVGAVLLGAAGLADLVASDEDAYVRTAVELARDANRRRDLRAGLRDRFARSKLLDHAAFTRNFEEALRQAWREWCARVCAPPH